MYNLVYEFVALLKELDIISEEAYHVFCRELSTKIMPSNSRDALTLVQECVAKAEDELRGKPVKVEPWLDRITALESRLDATEKLLTSKK